MIVYVIYYHTTPSLISHEGLCPFPDPKCRLFQVPAGGLSCCLQRRTQSTVADSVCVCTRMCELI